MATTPLAPLRPFKRLPASPFDAPGDDSEPEQAAVQYESETVEEPSSGAVTPSKFSFTSEEAPDLSAPPALQQRRKSFFQRAKQKKSPGSKLGGRRASITAQLFNKRLGKRSRSSSFGGELAGSNVTFNLEPEIADPSLMSDRARDDMANRAMAFEHGTYKLEDDLRGLDKEGIMRVRVQLSTAARESGEKIEQLLHQHYQAFISASKGIQAMEREVQSLRGFLTRENLLLSSLKDITGSDMTIAQNEQLSANERNANSWADSEEGKRWTAALQILDIAIAERRPVDALTLLKKAEKTLLPGQKSGLYSHSMGAGLDVKTDKQAQELVARRAKLVDLVTGLIRVTTVCTSRSQTATQVLGSLVGRSHALKVYLEAHTAQLRRLDQMLLKQHQAGGETDGTEFANALSQQVFGGISAACEDMTITFGKELKELSALFMVWALAETDRFAIMLKRHALSPFAAPAGLGPTIQCCLLAYVHCTSVKLSHGLHLMPRLARDLWSTIDQVLQRRIKRIAEDAKAAAKADIEQWMQSSQEDLDFVHRFVAAEKSWPTLLEVFPSADVLLDELEGVTKLCRPLEGPRLRDALNHAYTRLFKEYTSSIAEELKTYRDPENELPEELHPVVEAALNIATAIIEQFLPEMSQPLAKCGAICNTARLTRQLHVFRHALLPDHIQPGDSGLQSILSAQASLGPTAFEDSGFDVGGLSAEATDSPTMAAKISSRKVSWKEYKPSVLEVPTRSPRSGSGIDDSQTLEPGASGALDFKVSPESDSGYAQLLAQRGGAIENPFARESPGPAANLFACLDGWRSLAPESPHQQGIANGTRMNIQTRLQPKPPVIADQEAEEEEEDVAETAADTEEADESDPGPISDPAPSQKPSPAANGGDPDDHESDADSINDPGPYQKRGPVVRWGNLGLEDQPDSDAESEFRMEASLKHALGSSSVRNDSAARPIVLKSAIKSPFGSEPSRGGKKGGLRVEEDSENDEEKDDEPKALPVRQNGHTQFKPIAKTVKTPFSEVQDSAEKRDLPRVTRPRLPPSITSPFSSSTPAKPSTANPHQSGGIAVSFAGFAGAEGGDDDDDIEEMNEELSDYDEDDMIAQLRKKL